MSEQLSISLNIVIPNEILSQIKAVQAELNTSFKEIRDYDPTGHVSVLNKFMQDEEFPSFVEILNLYFQSVEPFKIGLDRFEKTKSNKYIFLYFDDESNKKLKRIHDELITKTKNIGTETWDGRPNIYEYVPHISIIKVAPLEIDDALAKLKNKQLKAKFSVTSLEISKEIKEHDVHKGFNRDTLIILTS